MVSLDIKLVDEKEKFEKVKLVKPHIIFNRLDVKFEKNFELLEINYKKKTFYVSFSLRPTYCYLGLYMVDIDKFVFNEIVNFIHKNFNVNQFFLIQSLNGKKTCIKTIHSLVEFPETQKDFDKKFSSRSRYNRRIKRKNLEKDFECEFLYFDKSKTTSLQ